jgi:hypothetical protein
MRERQVGDSALECHERAAGNGIVEMATAALALLPIPDIVRQPDRRTVVLDADTHLASQTSKILKVRPIAGRFAKLSHALTPP